MPPPDPRVFFAAERTLLAWVRTGVTVIGLGFVVAKFGLFLRLVDPEHAATPETGLSAMLGVAFVLLGAGAPALAAVQSLRFMRALAAHERPPGYSALPGIAIAFAIAAAGLLLAVYLVS